MAEKTRKAGRSISLDIKVWGCIDKIADKTQQDYSYIINQLLRQKFKLTVDPSFGDPESLFANK